MSTILPSTSYSGNNTVTGVAVKGDGYSNRQDGLHTVSYFLNGFVGYVVIQGTLAAQPEESDWFDISGTVHGDGSTVITENTFKNFTGNFVWIRAKLYEFTSGSVLKIQYNH